MPFIISQKLLHKYHQAAEAERGAKILRSKLRTKILDLIQDGAPVQPGELVLEVVDRETHTLSWAKLEAILDDDEIEFLREEVTPTVSTCVYVRPSRAMAHETEDSE